MPSPALWNCHVRSTCSVWHSMREDIDLQVTFDLVPEGAPVANRRHYIDWARGIAVLIMIHAHVLDAWTLPTERKSPPSATSMCSVDSPRRCFSGWRACH